MLHSKTSYSIGQTIRGRNNYPPLIEPLSARDVIARSNKSTISPPQNPAGPQGGELPIPVIEKSQQESTKATYSFDLQSKEMWTRPGKV